MFTVPAAADEIPVAEPVAAVVIDTLGHACWIFWVHRLNKGYSRLDPVSWRAVEVVGQFSRLWRVAAAVVVCVVVGVALFGDELHAAKRTAEAARTDNTATPRIVPVRFLVRRRAGMLSEAPFDRIGLGGAIREPVGRRRHVPAVCRQPTVIRSSR